MKKYALGTGAAALLFGACAEAPQNTSDNFGYEGTGIQFQVAPLTLDSLSDACYSFTVENGTPELVVGRGPEAAAAHTGLVTGTAMNSICASQFGNGDGGDASYVAPCDADQPNHTVTLWVDRLCATSTVPVTFDSTGFPDAASCTEIQSYVDPCPTGCELPVTCVENADTPVTFNFTIMGQADQGFFDIAVNFDDVFCSAKLDTCNTEGDPIQLIFDAQGARMDTVVLAVACTAGEGDVDTHITHAPLNVTCTDGTNTVGGALTTNTIDEEGNFALNGLSGAAYFGTESLSGVNKVYSNFAFGIPTGFTCNVNWQVVPSNGALTDPSATNTYNSYGYVNFEASGVGTGTAGCTYFPLDGLPGVPNAPTLNGQPAATSGVTTMYATGAFAQGESQLGEGDQDITPWP